MSTKVFHVLFLCTGNSARSVIAEVLLDSLGGGRFKGHSAGSKPTGQVNPLSLEVLREHGHPIEGLRSKSWDEFGLADAPAMDLVVTVCDNAANEVCPIWPGHPATVHLGFPDPAAATGTHAERLAEFRRVYAMIAAEIAKLIASGPNALGCR